jgi:hypothetical protein
MTTSSITTPTSHNIPLTSNSPSSLFVLGITVTHQHLNMLLSGLGYASEWWSMQLTDVWWLFWPFMTKQLWCHLRRKRSRQRSMWREWHVQSGGTGSCLLMGWSLCYFRSPDYMGRPGLTRTRITLLTVRYVSHSLRLHHHIVLTYAFQIISLPQNLLIVDYSLGHTGSVHNAWAFWSTQTFKNHNKIFGPGEWMWADSAYPPEMWSVTPFKKPVNGHLTAYRYAYESSTWWAC